MAMADQQKWLNSNQCTAGLLSCSYRLICLVNLFTLNSATVYRHSVAAFPSFEKQLFLLSVLYASFSSLRGLLETDYLLH